MLWPSLMEAAIKHFGWQPAMLGYGAIVLAILPLAALLRPAPEQPLPRVGHAGPRAGQRVLGLRPNVTLALICIAGFCCCVPMAVPASHLVAFCGDVGISPGHGAAMLSVMLACAFMSRQLWGLFADRFGGLMTVMTGSFFQMLAIGAFLLTREELGLFAIASAFGFGFSGIIPAYSVTIRDLYPSQEASWRIPVVLMVSMLGMAFGSWFAGLLFDTFLSYRPAFALGVAFNLVNLVLIAFLVSRTFGRRRLALAAT
jgi:MFS family permease